MCVCVCMYIHTYIYIYMYIYKIYIYICEYTFNILTNMHNYEYIHVVGTCLSHYYVEQYLTN